MGGAAVLADATRVAAPSDPNDPSDAVGRFTPMPPPTPPAAPLPTMLTTPVPAMERIGKAVGIVADDADDAAPPT